MSLCTYMQVHSDPKHAKEIFNLQISLKSPDTHVMASVDKIVILTTSGCVKSRRPTYCTNKHTHRLHMEYKYISLKKHDMNKHLHSFVLSFK